MDVNQEEIQKAFDFCVNVIESPPEEYRVVKQAILGLLHLSARRSDLRAKALPWILKVVQDPGVYRSNPRRFAVQSIGSVTYYDQTLIEPSIQLLMQLVKRGTETSQFVRKAAFVGLSRIGRRYPYFQRLLVPVFMHAYQHPMTKESIKWGVVIGIGKMAQANVALRTSFTPEAVALCRNASFRMRWAGIKALGHMSCPQGDLEPNEALEEQTFGIASELLKHGGWEPAIECLRSKDSQSFDDLTDEQWKDENVYLVQYAATHTLALILRSNPNKWWSRISVLFGKLLLNPKVASMIKAMVVITYGKIAYFIRKDSSFYLAIKNLLFELCANPNILVSEPATYGLVNFALAHQELFPEVKALVLAKLGGNLETATAFQLQYYLKTWCKIVAKDYTPMTNPRSQVISDQQALSTSSQGFGSFAQSLFASGGGDDENKQQDSKPGASAPPKRPASQLEMLRSVARDNRKVNKLCSIFSTSVIESVVLMLTDISVLDDREFVDNLKALITGYSEAAKNEIESITAEESSSNSAPNAAGAEDAKSSSKPGQDGITDQIVALLNLDLPLREAAVGALTNPKVLEDSIWLSNLKLTVFNEFAHATTSEVQESPAPAQFPSAPDSPTSPIFSSNPHDQAHYHAASSSSPGPARDPRQPQPHQNEHASSSSQSHPQGSSHSHLQRPTARNMQLRDQLSQLMALARSTTFSLDSNIVKDMQLPPMDPRMAQQPQQQQMQGPPQQQQSHDPRLPWQPPPQQPPLNAYPPPSHHSLQPSYPPPMNRLPPAAMPSHQGNPYVPQIHSAPAAPMHPYGTPIGTPNPPYASYTPPAPLQYAPPMGPHRGYSPAHQYPPPMPLYAPPPLMPYAPPSLGPPRVLQPPPSYPPPAGYGPPPGKRFLQSDPSDGPPNKRSRYH